MAKVETIQSGRFAVLAFDPGETTGVAALHVDLNYGTKKECLRNALMKKTTEVKGPWFQQAKELVNIGTKFSYVAQVEHQVPADNVVIVFEDFVLRRRQEGGATGNLTSIWVAAPAACDLIHLGQNVVWQQPSEAMFIDNVKLKDYDLYVIGSEHERDAMRHAATRVDKVLP